MKPLYTSVTMKIVTVSWDKYFLMIMKKKRDKCIQMHFIGKSYVNTVYKCDDGKKSDHSEKKSVTSVYNVLYREKL